MKGILLLRRSPENTNNKTGLGIYSDNVERELKRNGTSYETSYTNLSTGKGNLGFLINGIFKPFLGMLRNRGYGTYHATDEMCGMFFPFMKGRKIVTFHHILREGENSKLYTLLWKFVSKIAAKYSDRIIAISQETKDDIISTFNVPEDKITVIMNMVDDGFTTLEGVKKKKIIGCVSTFTPPKNVSAAIRAFAHFVKMEGTDDYRMVICGKGREYDNLVKESESLGIRERVDFISNLSEEELIRFYNEMCVLANPSLREGFGFVNIEAQKCSTPVVYFKDAAIPAEVTKYAVRSEDVDDFANNLHRLITDREFRCEVVNNGKEYAERFNKDFGKKLLNVYNQND